MAKKASQAKQNDHAATEGTPSQAEQVGYHKGSIMTLSKERAELVRILGIVEQLMQMHASALQELGVKLDSDTQAVVQPQQAAPKAKKPPIEDIL
ncbi:TPA: hypothetical protein HA251_08680 [Candidatus Woesearchaeota archaeon]|nr:hypothetical protein [Candidatus Woesearchaeota archaeon]